MRIIRIQRMLSIMAVFILLGGCATVYEECSDIPQKSPAYEVCTDIAREYARVDYIESTFKPWLQGCKAADGFPVYRGQSISRHLTRALDNDFRTYERVRRIELVGFECASSLTMN